MCGCHNEVLCAGVVSVDGFKFSFWIYSHHYFFLLSFDVLNFIEGKFCLEVWDFFFEIEVFFSSYFCSSGKSLEACIIGSLYCWANNIFQTLPFASNRQELFTTFCKLSSRIFQKNFILLRLKLGFYGWASDKDEKEVLKERKEKKKKQSSPP